MFLFVLSILLLIASVIMLFAPKVRSYAAVSFGLAIVMFGASALVVVPAGHVGVPVLFGSVRPASFTEGLHIANPLYNVNHMTIRTQNYTMRRGSRDGGPIVAISKDGLRMPLEVSILFHLAGPDAPWVYQKFGVNYARSIIVPAARTAVREAASRFTATEAYSTRRELLAQLMQKRLSVQIKEMIARRGGTKRIAVIVDNVLLRNVDLPNTVKHAIEQKLAADQEAQRMQFILAKERQEAMRKEIEAQGIARFQQIVTQGISDKLLQWKGIEATMKLAASRNAKVVIIGGKDGLPLILNAGAK